MICTTADCEAESTLYLCGHCIRDLQAWIDKVPEVRAELFTTMAKLDNTAPARGDGGNGATKESPLPIREAAMEKRHALRLWQGHSAQKLANDQHAGNYAPMLKNLITSAERIMDNHPETRVITTCPCGGTVTTQNERPEPTTENPDPEDWGNCRTCGEPICRTEQGTRQRIQEGVPESMKTRDALKWIRDNSHISIKSTDVRNWAREGKLTRTNPEAEDERPAYNIADILTIHYRHAGENKRPANF